MSIKRYEIQILSAVQINYDKPIAQNYQGIHAKFNIN